MTPISPLAPSPFAKIRKGIVKLHNKKPQAAAAIDKRVTEVLAAFGERILPITREIADLWGQLLAQIDRHTDDTGLAATARVHGLILVTRNLKHVSDRGVEVLDPFKAR